MNDSSSTFNKVLGCLPRGWAGGCHCPGHWMPGVYHIVPCCNKPHMSERDAKRRIDEIMGREPKAVRQRICLTCGGSGGFAPMDAMDGWETCDVCGGRGWEIRQPLPER